MDSDLRLAAQQLSEVKLEELQVRWRMQFGRSVPKNLPRRLLFRLFLYKLQTEKFGDLSSETSEYLSSIGLGADIGPPDPSTAGPGGLRPGTVLVREHAGASHHVMVTHEGFSWNGTDFKSLSQVATAITGTRWNGPRFFGLRDQRP